MGEGSRATVYDATVGMGAGVLLGERENREVTKLLLRFATLDFLRDAEVLVGAFSTSLIGASDFSSGTGAVVLLAWASGMGGIGGASVALCGGVSS